jgi:D-alanyl-D-alanine carboxypeptidase
LPILNEKNNKIKTTAMPNVIRILKIMFAVFILLQIVFYTNLYAHQSVDITKLDRYIDNLGKNNQNMFTISISEKEKNVYSRSIGYADTSLTKLSNAGTLYRIGGLSKTFTAVIVMQMVEEKMIQLGTPISRFFPEIPNGNHISVGDLLFESLDIRDYMLGGKFYRLIKSDYVFEQVMLEEKLLKAHPGAEANTYSFNNANYQVIGMIIERLTGKSFGEVLKERVLDRIGLNNTYMGEVKSANNQEACSYTLLNGEITPNGKWDLLSVAPSAGIVSTPKDLRKFMEALFNHQLVTEKSLQRLSAGLTEMKFGNKTGLGSVGRIDAFTSEMLYFPADNICISFSSNMQGFSYNKVMSEVVEIIYGS